MGEAWVDGRYTGIRACIERGKQEGVDKVMARGGARATLWGFRSECDEIVLPNQVRIFREHGPYDGLYEATSDEEYHEADALRMSRTDQFRIESSLREPEQGEAERESGQRRFEANREAIDRTVEYLWLFRRGEVWVETVEDTERQMGVGWSLVRRPQGPATGEYRMTKEDCDDFVPFVEYMEQAKVSILKPENRRRVDRAVERFGFAIGRDRADLQVTDLMTAFETLLLADNGRDPGGRLAAGARMLTGRTKEERREVGSRITQAYKARSDYVHGKEVTVEYQHLQKVLQDFRNTVLKFCDIPQKEDLAGHLRGLTRDPNAPYATYPAWWNPEGRGPEYANRP